MTVSGLIGECRVMFSFKIWGLEGGCKWQSDP